VRQANALGKFVTDPKHAHVFHLVPPGARLPKGVTQASPPMVESVRVARRGTPDGRVAFDVVAEVTQSCTVQRAGDLFEVTGGCTLVIDPQGEIRYAIYKRSTSENRQKRQQAAMRGPLKAFWGKSGRRFVQKPEMLRRLHAGSG
jgi:hypothetical protein